MPWSPAKNCSIARAVFLTFLGGRISKRTQSNLPIKILLLHLSHKFLARTKKSHGIQIHQREIRNPMANKTTDKANEIVVEKPSIDYIIPPNLIFKKRFRR